MNAEEYKQAISQNDVLDHTTLNITLKELASKHEMKLAANLKRILEKNKIAKPDLHFKSNDTSVSYYKVDLSSNDIETIIDIFVELEADHVDKNGNTTPTASFYATLVDKWTRLA